MKDFYGVIPLIYILLASGICVVCGYSIGFRAGHGEGYLRGRAISQAMREKQVSA